MESDDQIFRYLKNCGFIYARTAKRFDLSVDRVKKIAANNGINITSRRGKDTPKELVEAMLKDAGKDYDQNVGLKHGMSKTTVRKYRELADIPLYKPKRRLKRVGKSTANQETLDRGYTCKGVEEYWLENREIDQLMLTWSRPCGIS